jgi:nucleoside-diphosphate-sugar epimerase
MLNRKRVLMTGHKGYIGSVMAPVFVAAGHEVVGLDTGYFNACSLPGDELSIREITKDIRDLTAADLAGFDAVVHLAALSNDPIGNLNNDWTGAINRDASIRLAELARDAGVERFLFSSSCIMYGMTELAEVTEESPLDPKTEYARSKVASERAISALARDGFSPVFLRNGTVYGFSERMRLDTVLNDFTAQGYLFGKVVVMSDGKPWRPVIHVEDVALSFERVLTAPVDLIHNRAFNNGADHLNYQVIELATIVAETIPGCTVEVHADAGADQRTYKASFAKMRATFSDHFYKWNARTGAKQLYDVFRANKLTPDDYHGKRFVRLRWLQHLLESNTLDGDLRWSAAPVPHA